MKPTFILFFLLGTLLNAQTFIQGHVTDAETGEALPYVNIGVPQLGIGTVSNDSGAYYLEIPSKVKQGKLRFSMIGFQSFELEIEALNQKDKEAHDIRLQPKTTAL